MKLEIDFFDVWLICILPLRWRHHYSQHKQTFGFPLFDNFFKHLLTLKTSHDMQVGFMI